MNEWLLVLKNFGVRCAPVLQLLPEEDELLLVRRDALLLSLGTGIGVWGEVGEG